MKLRIALVLVACVVVLRLLFGGPTITKGQVKNLTNRMWVSKVPEHDRDIVFFFALLEQNRNKVGLLMNASTYRFMGDIIRYRLDGDELTILVMQDETKAAFKVRTWECDDAPEPFDLCLELRRGGRSAVLYSEKSETFDAADFERAPWGMLKRPQISGESAACKDCEDRLPEEFGILKFESAN